MQPGSSALRADGVTVRFGGVRALDDVSLDAAGGQVTGVIGPNGAGKTTLLDVLTGLRSPSSGSVALGGVDVTRWSATRLARCGVRRTFQRQQAFGWLTVEENVAVAVEWRTRRLRDLVVSTRSWAPSVRQAVDEALVTCGLEDCRTKPAGSMPIGTLRLMELARALVGQPKLLLLDEPTSGLHQAQTERYAEIVRDYAQRSGAAVVLVEHDVDFVMTLSAVVVVLEAGSVLASGPPVAIRRDDRVIEAYLGAAVEVAG